MNNLVEQMGIAQLINLINEYDKNFSEFLCDKYGTEKLVGYYENLEAQFPDNPTEEEESECLQNMKSLVVAFYAKEFGVEDSTK